MKKYISIILLVLFAVVGSAAQNKVSISSGQGVPGDIITVDVSLQNSDEVTAVEVVIPLVDKQLTYVDGSCAINSERINGHQHNVAVGGGALRIFIYSLEQKTLNGNNGIIASFNLKLGKAPAEYPLQPQAVLSDVAGNELPVIVDNGILKIVAPQVEVVTQSVDFGHIPIRSQHSKSITLRNSGTSTLNVTGLQFSAPEFTATETSFTVEPGKTKSVVVNYTPTVRGAVEESVTVISDAINGNATIKLIADPYSVNELHCSRVEGALGEEVTVELRMNNMEPIVGLQTTFTLPDGIEYVDGSFAPTERAVSHTATASVNSNSLVLFLYSFGNSVMDGNDGVVATFRLRLKCNSGNYYIVPQNTVLSNVTEEDMTSAVSGNYIVVKSPNISGNSELDFGESPITETAKANYSVRNSGNATLVINGVAFLSTGYRV
ncbi:MAG: choice-of-anchor D domain-containing protein, partial [Bacteroidaceae bacterium]|nr:choice-of-anchor D domain-containing protein [Bacteroidaceae bacterium]